VKEELVAKLTGLGFTKTEARVYLALVENPNLSAQQVSYVSKVQRTQIYGILKRLINLGLVIEKQTERGKLYESMPPVMLVNLVEKKTRTLIEESKSISNQLEEIYREHRQKSPDTPEIEVVRNLKKALELTSEYLSSSGVDEILFIAETPFTFPADGEGPAPPFPEGETLTTKLPDGRTGKLKILAEDYEGVIDDLEKNLLFRWGTKLTQLDPQSFEIRLTTTPLKIRTFLIGNRMTIFKIPELGERDKVIHIFVKSKLLTEYISSLLKPIWESAKVVPVGPEREKLLKQQSETGKKRKKK